MDSNHRRHSQQIYSLPHLATLVTTQKLYISKASAKVMLLFDITKFFRYFFLFSFKKCSFSPIKQVFPLSFTFLPFLSFYLYHMSSAVFPRQPSVLVMLIFLDGNEYREGKDYGQQEERDTDDNDEDRGVEQHMLCCLVHFC